MSDSNEKISNLIEKDNVVLFMKGTPDFPQCGFSANVVGILKYFGVKFSSINVLDDNEIRSSIGVALDWYSPVGPMNFSTAQPLTKSENDVI